MIENYMEMKNYFGKSQGIGILSTADGNGKVNAAVYSRPNFSEDGQIAFIMPGRLTHANLEANPYAHYLFVEQGSRSQGKRINLTLVRSERNSARIQELKRSNRGNPDDDHWLMIFRIDQVMPLVGAP